MILQARLPGFYSGALLGTERLKKYSREISMNPFCICVVYLSVLSSFSCLLVEDSFSCSLVLLLSFLHGLALLLS